MRELLQSALVDTPHKREGTDRGQDVTSHNAYYVKKP